MADANQGLVTGSRGAYRWLTTGQHDLHTLLDRCPQVVTGKFLAVTSQDSGDLTFTEEEKLAGWESRNDIAYGPQVQSPLTIQHGKCGGFDEWYVFDSPHDLGKIWRDNVFEAPITPDQVSVFVNFGTFELHNPDVEDLTSIFWKQLDWIQPESYIADGFSFLTFVTREEGLFDLVVEALSDKRSEI
jgi:hypothetical protein